MRQFTRSRFALSEGGEYTIRATAWTAVFLALAGTAVDGASNLRWQSMVSGTETVTAMVDEFVRSNEAGLGAATTGHAETGLRHATDDGGLRTAAAPAPGKGLHASANPVRPTSAPIPLPRAESEDDKGVLAAACAGAEPWLGRCRRGVLQLALPGTHALGVERSHTLVNGAR